ncbi:MAG: hypothetical protein WBA29_07730 [Xanthobacteraceae bacterium]
MNMLIFFHGSSAGVKATRHESHAQDGGTLFAATPIRCRFRPRTSVRQSCHGFGILNGVHPSDGAGKAIVLRSQPLARATGPCPSVAQPPDCRWTFLHLSPQSRIYPTLFFKTQLG